MKAFHFAALAIAIAAPGAAGGQRIASEVVAGDNFPMMPARFPGGVLAYPDLVYANVAGFRPLRLDLYAASHRPGGTRRPLVIYIHGGAWRFGHSRAAGAFADFPSVLASLAGRGFVVASINYRLSEEARFPAPLEDVRASIRYLRGQADRFGIDPERIILWGSSAGGQLAALTATACDVGTFAGAGAQSSPSGTEAATPGPTCVRGAAIWYGAFDLATLEGDGGRAQQPSPATAFLGCDPRQCSDLAMRASPVSHVDQSDPPMLLIHGAQDQVISADQSRAMSARLRAAGVPAALIILPGAGHSWIGPTPDATREASLSALRRTFDFFDEIARADGPRR